MASTRGQYIRTIVCKFHIVHIDNIKVYPSHSITSVFDPLLDPPSLIRIGNVTRPRLDVP